MSKPVNKTLIGLFVLTALALVFAAVLILGSGTFFTPKEKLVMFFEGSVKGLEVGAPVIFRGVKVGEVKEIELLFNPDDWSALIPVYVQINPRAFTVSRKEADDHSEKEYVPIEPLIERGLKAQLQIRSFVTGQLTVNLDLLPEKPMKLAGLDNRYPEIPTLPTSLEELERTLQNLDLPDLVKKINRTVEGIERFVNSPELTGSVISMNKALKDADRLINNLDAQAAPLMASLKETSKAAQAALANIEHTFSMKDGVPAMIEGTLSTANASLQRAEKTLATIQNIVRDNADIGDALTDTLRELSASARSIRFLSDYLERHPEALLSGKGASKGE